MSQYVKRFSRNTTGRDLIVGDIHGHFTKLQNALVALGFNPASDRLFSVGDLVDRGPESHISLEWIDMPWFHVVAGNHEDFAIRFPDGNMPLDNYAANGGSWNIANSMDDRLKFSYAFSALPVAIELETDAGLVGIVHADCPLPSWRDFIAKMENAETPKRERERLIDLAQWSRGRVESMFDGGVSDVLAVVVGHTPMERWASLGNVIYIDTGAWRGGEFCILDAATLRPAEKSSLIWGDA
jgi:serine/threonine protein phosphatase 1